MKCHEFKKYLYNNPDILADTGKESDFHFHVKNCSICQQEYKSYISMLSRLRLSAVPEETDEFWQKMHTSLLAKVDSTTPSNSNIKPFKIPVRKIYPFAIAALLLLSVFSISFIKNFTKSGVNAHIVQSPKIINLHGIAFADILNGNKNAQLKLQSGISEGNTIQTTSASSLTLQVDQASTIDLHESSSLVISTYTKHKQLYSLNQGQVDVHVSKRNPDQTFKINTPNASCIVVGTRFHVAVEQNQKTGQFTTTLTVNEGRVLFSVSDSIKMYVDSGKTVSAVNNCFLLSSVLGSDQITPPGKKFNKKVTKDDTCTTSIISFQNTKDTTSEKIDNTLSHVSQLINAGNLDEAISELSKTGSDPSISPFLKIAVLQKKAVCWRLKKEFDKAIFVLDSIFSNTHSTKSQKESALFQIATIHQSDLHDFNTTIEDLNKYLKIFPNGIWSEETMYTLAELYYFKKQYNESAQTYRKYINVFPKSNRLENAIYTLARIYSNDLNNCENAINLYLRMENDFPKSELTDDAVFWKAECLYHQGRVNQALEAFQSYLIKFPAGKWVTEAKTRVTTTETAGAK